MNKTVKKIGVSLLLVILLPLLIFVVLEISSLKENEKVIERIYENQLDAILFSVNQYSEDIAGSWRGRINSSIALNEPETSAFREVTKNFLNENPSILTIIISDEKGNSITIFNNDNANQIEKTDTKAIKNFFTNNSDKINRLFLYEKSGYLKIEPVEEKLLPGSSTLLFLLDAINNESKYCVMLIDAESFIRLVLSRKILSVAQDEFAVFVYNSDIKIGFNAPANLKTDDVKIEKALWLLPEYKLGITLKSGTIESLVKERTVTNFILILVLTLVLIAGLIIVFRNIKKEVELAQIKSDFVSNVSHELRTPLSLISMFAETLELGRVKSDEKRQEYYKIISSETSRLGGIVNKILNFSQIEAGKRKYHIEKVNINDLAENVVNTYRFHLQSKGFKFSYELEDKLPSIKADGEAVSEAVINLIDNAVKYSLYRKEILLKTGITNGKVFIEVRDKGIGISEENRQKIFEKFFRVTSGNLHNTKGTGLGLTIVKHIMDAHGGEVTLESKAGAGSSFKLNFNLKDEK
jgi:two-component system phosphate regulon sensor histidine kinase PhoR